MTREAVAGRLLCLVLVFALVGRVVVAVMNSIYCRTSSPYVQAQLRTLHGVVESFHPRVPASPYGFDALISAQELASTPLDVWGRPFSIWFRAGTSSFVIASSGQDATWGTDDDLAMRNTPWPAHTALPPQPKPRAW